MSVTFTADLKSCNFANVNALAVMEMVGFPIPIEPWGKLEPGALPEVMRGIIRAINVSRVRAPFTRETVEHNRVGYCRVVECGTTDESNLYRLRALQQVVDEAILNQVPLTWG